MFGAFMFVLSHTGNTRECLEVVRAIKAETLTGADTIAITSSGDSPLALACNYDIIYDVGSDTPLAHGLPVLANYVQAGILDSIGLDLIQRHGVTKEMVKEWHPQGTHIK